MKFPFMELTILLNEYNKVLEEAQSKAIFVRNIQLQMDKISEIDDLIVKIEQYKIESISAQNEQKSNFLLCLLFVAEAIKQEILTITYLKENNIAVAWDCLINAQELISTAIRNHPFSGDYLLGYAERLHLYEVLLFPKMKFASRGSIVGKTQCSICKQKYGECDHLKGYAYMGKICSEITLEIIEIEEISLVDNPADKRCRILSFPSNGKQYDIFTHMEIEGK